MAALDSHFTRFLKDLSSPRLRAGHADQRAMVALWVNCSHNLPKLGSLPFLVSPTAVDFLCFQA